jgi:hypothetical protein
LNPSVLFFNLLSLKSVFQACLTASAMHGEPISPFPQHIQSQINRGKDDLPTFLRVLLVAFVRYENQLIALGRYSSFQRKLLHVFV